MATTIAGSRNERDLNKLDKHGFKDLKQNVHNGKTTNGYMKTNDLRNGDTVSTLIFIYLLPFLYHSRLCLLCQKRDTTVAVKSMRRHFLHILFWSY